MYVIWSNEHKKWWRPNSMGYALRIKDAGLYGREEALQIVEGATKHQWDNGPPNEIAVRVEDLPDEAKVLLGQL